MTLLFIDGSGRQGSYNRLLLEAFAQELGRQGFSFEAVTVCATSHRVPNLVVDHIRTPDATAACDDLRDKAMAAKAMIIASPEYNGGPTGGLKNLIDWMTRPNEAHPKGNPFDMKPTVLLSASTGSLGGIKGLQVMRLIMGHLRALVLPEQVALPHADKAFESDGRLKPGLAAELTQSAAAQLIGLLSR